MLPTGQVPTLLTAFVLLCPQPQAAGQYCNNWVTCFLAAAPSCAGIGSKPVLHSGWSTISLTAASVLLAA